MKKLLVYSTLCSVVCGLSLNGMEGESLYKFGTYINREPKEETVQAAPICAIQPDETQDPTPIETLRKCTFVFDSTDCVLGKFKKDPKNTNPDGMELSCELKHKTIDKPLKFPLHPGKIDESTGEFVEEDANAPIDFCLKTGNLPISQQDRRRFLSENPYYADVRIEDLIAYNQIKCQVQLLPTFRIGIPSVDIITGQPTFEEVIAYPGDKVTFTIKRDGNPQQTFSTSITTAQSAAFKAPEQKLSAASIAGAQVIKRSAAIAVSNTRNPRSKSPIRKDPEADRREVSTKALASKRVVELIKIEVPNINELSCIFHDSEDSYESL
jgi:hypothetical protein